ncbi:MAG: pilus assembly protein PilP [Gammaproteobacteria bacterium]|nr:pilus assembly protein PilP [Gammaproteobacteria bacterium]
MLTKTRQMEQLTTRQATVKLLSISLLSMTLFACGSENVSDLHSYVSEIKARKAGDIPPLPEVQSYSTYDYKEATLRDPFLPTVSRKLARSNNGVRPDNNRQRQVLEQFPLATLKMVGSLEQSGDRWALIKSQDGTLYRTKPGKYMGQDNGKILRVTETDVVLQEIVPDGLGGWVRRQATLSVSE